MSAAQDERRYPIKEQQRLLAGVPKTATIHRRATGKRFVGVTCEWKPTPLPPPGRRCRSGSLMAHHWLVTRLQDAAWTPLAALLAGGAAGAGRQVVTVDPALTSQDCSGCGHRQTALTLADRTSTCVQ